MNQIKLMVSSAESSTPAPFSVFITPGLLAVNAPNGLTTSPIATVNVISGEPDFTYAWSSDNSSVSITNPTSSSTRFSASGFDSEVEATITVTVTDNSSNEETDTIRVFFFFGDLGQRFS